MYGDVIDFSIYPYLSRERKVTTRFTRGLRGQDLGWSTRNECTEKRATIAFLEIVIGLL